MNHPYVYIGCFISHKELYTIFNKLNGSRLSKIIEFPHVTFLYKPQFVDESLFGEKIRIRIVGYGNDGNNEGVKVELTSVNPKINSMIKQIDVPHITLSVSDIGKPVNTRHLNYECINPFEIEGYFGGYTRDRKVVVNAKE